MNLDSLRPFISGIVASLVAAFVAWLGDRFHFIINHEQQEGLNLFVFGVVWTLVNKTLAKFINPGDAASKHLIVVQRDLVQQVKTDEKIMKASQELEAKNNQQP